MGSIRPHIIFCCVSYNDVILVSHQTEVDNFTTGIRSILAELPLDGPKKLTYPLDSFQVHILIDDIVIFACIANTNGKHLLPFTLLENVKSKFHATPSLPSRSQSAAENEFDRDFGPILTSVMHDFNSGRGDQISLLKSQVEDVKKVMLDNVEKIIDRGERLEDLISKTEDLEASGAGFRQQAREVHRRARCKNLKMWLIISSFLGLVLLIALLIAIGVIPL